MKKIKSVVCPYNPRHIMPEISLAGHLSKCSARLNPDFVACQYNVMHIHHKYDIQDHEEGNCISHSDCPSKFDFFLEEDWGLEECPTRGMPI
jgi:hypothetical protein